MISIRFVAPAEVKDELGVVVQRFAEGQRVPAASMSLASRLYWLSTGLAESVDEPADPSGAAERPARARRRRKAAPRA